MVFDGLSVADLASANRTYTCKTKPVERHGGVVDATFDKLHGKEMDAVKSPGHYIILDKETIELIALGLTATEWRGYCYGNIIKYRMRSGRKYKNEAAVDIAKADEMEDIYNRFIHLCRE